MADNRLTIYFQPTNFLSQIGFVYVLYIVYLFFHKGNLKKKIGSEYLAKLTASLEIGVLEIFEKLSN